tara:strand:+ start:1871 stop:2629 length:759 start_codon:yes stop_codon:yes gene_type:complete
MATFSFDQLTDSQPTTSVKSKSSLASQKAALETLKGLSASGQTPSWLTGDLKIKEAGGKQPYSAKQLHAAQTGVRMMLADMDLAEIEKEYLESDGEEGYNPRNIVDRAAQSSLALFSKTPLGDIIMSKQGEQYKRAMAEFLQAQLRDETGAVINESEIPMIEARYQPKVAEAFETYESKARARRILIDAMRGVVGEKLWNEMLEKQTTLQNPGNSANELDVIERINSSGEFREKFQQKFPRQYQYYIDRNMI